MAQWAPLKSDTLDALASEILHNYGKGRVFVAVDGLAATAAFADELAEAIRRTGHQVFRASLGDFQHRRVLRFPAGSDAPKPGYDVETFTRVLVDPFRDSAAGSFVLAAFDAERDAPIEPKWMTAKPDAILLVDGDQAQAPELRGLWHFVIWLQNAAVPTPAQAEYVKRIRPSAAANAIINGTDPEHPRRNFADSC